MGTGKGIVSPGSRIAVVFASALPWYDDGKVLLYVGGSPDSIVAKLVDGAAQDLPDDRGFTSDGYRAGRA